MDTYSQYDIYNGLLYLKAGIMNILNKDSKRTITFDKYVPISMIIDCLKELGYIIEEDFTFSDWESDYFDFKFHKENTKGHIFGNWYSGKSKIQYD